ncbi:MAG: TlpA family protein disulfide reductase [Rhodobacteraceae bacterium]|nr:TlpA family protein disulfide reductase [Paracoccaceae bacterium]
MRLIRSALLYISLALGANTALADMSSIMDLRTGDMKKLNFHSEPKEVSQAEFMLEDDTGTATLADYQGKYVLLNFWATWCAPCRAEMPMLSALQDEFGGEDFEVLTLATGRNSPKGIEKFFADTGITNLPRHQDPKQAVAREMGVLGLPITVILDPEGREIARLIGDAEWDSDSARAIIAALVKNRTDS